MVFQNLSLLPISTPRSHFLKALRPLPGRQDGASVGSSKASLCGVYFLFGPDLITVSAPFCVRATKAG